MDDNLMKGRSQPTNYRDSIELTSRIAVSENKGTQSDERDMDRMGKLQELRVCHKPAPRISGHTNRRPAAIQVPDHLRLWCTPRQHMGILNDVCSLRPTFKSTTDKTLQRYRNLTLQRRPRRWDLVARCRLLRHVLRHAFISRDGINVSNYQSFWTELRSDHRIRAPTAGGQYHWISELSPRKYQKILSYITGMSLIVSL